MTSTPLASLLRSRMGALDITSSGLASVLTERGARISRQAVDLWLSDGCMSDRFRRPVAEALGIPLETLLLACADTAAPMTSPTGAA